MYSNVSSRKVLSKSPKNPVAFNDKFKKGVFFIPMCIGGGFLYNTDKGLVDFETFDNNEFTWEEIIADGQGDLQIYWDGSIVCETKSEKLNFGEDQVERYTHTELTYKVGNYGFGFATESGFGFEVGSDVSYNDFNTMTHKEEITLLVKPEDLNGVDLTKFRLYCFPELFKKKVFFISDMIVHRDINNQEKIISYEITFSHISNKFQKSGKAVEEYFHFSMIGNGYSWPTVDRENKQILLDQNCLKSNGVNKCKEEMFNASMLNNTNFIGWEINDNDPFVGDITSIVPNQEYTQAKQIFYAPKVIHTCNYTAGETTILNRKSTPESDFRIMFNCDFTEDSYSTWAKYFESQFSNDFSVPYAGECAYKGSVDLASYEALNEPLKPTTEVKYTQKGVYSPYVETDGFDITMSSTTENNPTWADINCFNYWCMNDIYTLPFSFVLHILNQPKQWPVIGGIFNILGGFGWGWDEQYRRISDGTNIKKSITCLAPSSMIDIAQKNWKIVNEGKDNQFFINDFYNKESDDRFNANNRSVIMEYNFTSDFVISGTTLDNLDTTLKSLTPNTSWLGNDFIYNGTKDSEGVRNLVKAYPDSGNALRLNSDFRVKKQITDKRFIICGIANKNAFGQSQKFTFYSNNENVWVGAFLTNTNFRDNSRDWTNTYTINNINNVSGFKREFEYPNISSKGSVVGRWEFNDFVEPFIFGEDIISSLRIDTTATYGQGINVSLKSIKPQMPNISITEDQQGHLDYVSSTFGNNYTIESNSYTLSFADEPSISTQEQLLDYIEQKIQNNIINIEYEYGIQYPYGYKSYTTTKWDWEIKPEINSYYKKKFTFSYGNITNIVKDYSAGTITFSSNDAEKKYTWKDIPTGYKDIIYCNIKNVGEKALETNFNWDNTIDKQNTDTFKLEISSFDITSKTFDIKVYNINTSNNIFSMKHKFNTPDPETYYIVVKDTNYNVINLKHVNNQPEIYYYSIINFNPLGHPTHVYGDYWTNEYFKINKIIFE